MSTRSTPWSFNIHMLSWCCTRIQCFFWLYGTLHENRWCHSGNEQRKQIEHFIICISKLYAWVGYSICCSIVNNYLFQFFYAHSSHVALQETNKQIKATDNSASFSMLLCEAPAITGDRWRGNTHDRNVKINNCVIHTSPLHGAYARTQTSIRLYQSEREFFKVASDSIICSCCLFLKHLLLLFISKLFIYIPSR